MIKKHEFIQVEITLEDELNENDWVVANLEHTAFLRVNYDSNNWGLLKEQLSDDHTAIESTARAQLIDDAAALGKAEYIDQTEFLNIVKYLNKEEDPQPFIPAISALSYFDSMLDEDYYTYEKFKVFIFYTLSIEIKIKLFQQ